MLNRSTSYDRREVMTKAWARYRAAYGAYPGFRRDAFACALRIEWAAVKYRARKAAEAAQIAKENAEIAAIAEAARAVPVAVRPLSEMEQRIDDLKYLPFSVNIAAEAQRIRAQYTRQAA